MFIQFFLLFASEAELNQIFVEEMEFILCWTHTQSFRF